MSTVHLYFLAITQNLKPALCMLAPELQLVSQAWATCLFTNVSSMDEFLCFEHRHLLLSCNFLIYVLLRIAYLVWRWHIFLCLKYCCEFTFLDVNVNVSHSWFPERLMSWEIIMYKDLDNRDIAQLTSVKWNNHRNYSTSYWTLVIRTIALDHLSNLQQTKSVLHMHDSHVLFQFHTSPAATNLAAPTPVHVNYDQELSKFYNTICYQINKSCVKDSHDRQITSDRK